MNKELVVFKVKLPKLALLAGFLVGATVMARFAWRHLH
jgi:hypothetical protein